MSLRRSLLSATFCVSTMLSTSAPAALAATTPTGAVAPADLAQASVIADNTPTATPIKHLVVIYDENISFDHYFGTYPHATNPAGEPAFKRKGGPVDVNNLVTAKLLTNNPNYTNSANGTGAANPFRLDRTQAATADQNHAYTPEQEAYDGGKMDMFPKYTGSGTSGGVGAFGTKGQVMGYYDGNTVTAMWNYAQTYALDDNAYTDTYGPSTPGAVEAISGQTNGVTPVLGTSGNYIPDGQNGLTLIGDVDPAYDACSSTSTTIQMTAKNIGDLLNGAKITWGGFMGGFNLDISNANGTSGCGRSTVSTIVGETVADYVPHHNWFQYYASTSNPTHARPSKTVDIGFTFDHSGSADPANHEYDLKDFYTSVAQGNFPSVSYIKMPAYQDAHAGYSDPLDEQAGVVKLVNFLEQQPDWKNTAIIITYDDSDGWYDHAFTAPTQSSYNATADQLYGPGVCGTGTAPDGLNGAPVNGRCGPGTRIPFLVISPYARQNFISDNQITQASIVRFIEDNWLGGKRLGGGSFDKTSGKIDPLFDFSSPSAPTLLLSETTGEPKS